MEESVIELKNISISYNRGIILNNISMGFPKGKLIAITGPSGCGKSTLLKIIAGLIYPDKGDVYIEGKNILNLTRQTLFQLRKRQAFVFQDSALISNLNVFDNIALPLRYHYHLNKEEVNTKVDNILENFDLKGVSYLLPAHLSIGQRKLAGFARGLIVEPEILFFDEPVTGIDAIAREKIIDKILPLRDNPNITAIMVSHNIDFIKSSCDYIALIYNNKLFAYGRKDEILKSKDPIIQGILSIIIDEEALVAEEIYGILSGT